MLPLALSSGAGANSQQAIGTGVMGGMITATVLAVFFVPVFYVVVRRIVPVKRVAPHSQSIAPPRPPSPVPHAVRKPAGGPVDGGQA